MKIGIIGTGVFAIALSSILFENKHDITMWSTFNDEINNLKCNKIRNNLDNYKIPEKIEFTTDLEMTTKDKDIIIIAIPTEYVYKTWCKLKQYIKKQHICIASKGIDSTKKMFLPEIIKSEINYDNVSVISGPSFAIDIIKKGIVGLNIASYNEKSGNIIYEAFKNDKTNLYLTNDVIGTCYLGTIKNILAIACGIIDGLGYPISTQTLFITIAIQDILGYIESLGGRKETVYSFAGIGDVILSCTSVKSRNYTYGKLIGSKDKEINLYLKANTVEGLSNIATLKSLNKFNNSKIINLLYDIIFNHKDPNQIIAFLTQKK